MLRGFAAGSGPLRLKGTEPIAPVGLARGFLRASPRTSIFEQGGRHGGGVLGPITGALDFATDRSRRAMRQQIEIRPLQAIRYPAKDWLDRQAHQHRSCAATFADVSSERRCIRRK